MLSPSPCRIIVTVALADASGAELDSTAHSFEPQSAVGHAGISFVFEKDDQYHHTFGGIDVRISPGLRDPYENFQISTSWTGDVYADIETEELPRLQSIKLSVKWAGPNSGKTDASQRTEEHASKHLELANAPLPQPSNTPREGRIANSETEDRPALTESQASPLSTAPYVEVRSAEAATLPPRSDPPESSLTGAAPAITAFGTLDSTHRTAPPSRADVNLTPGTNYVA
jgi:hypothetical protein